MILDDLLGLAAEAESDAEAYEVDAREAVRALVAPHDALQIHGGNGYALEYPASRVLCDARILNIFGGAAEIQAQVVCRGLIEGRN